MQLGKEINGGGEGTIYEVANNPSLVAKIYHDPKRCAHLKTTINDFRKLPSEFIKPLDTIDKSGVIIGHTMDYVDQSYYPISGLKYQSFCTKKKISDKQKVILLEKVSSLVQEAHNIGFVIGDLNPENILTNGKEIRFIDTASYQTPGGRHNQVLQPEITDWYYNAKVSKESDWFALSIIMFEAMTHTHPYKGQHPNYKGADKLKNRMIDKFSVMRKNAGLKIHKSYREFTGHQKDIYFKIMEEGLRVFPSLSKVVMAPVVKIDLSSDKIHEKLVYTGDIIDFHFNGNRFQVNGNVFEIKGVRWVEEIGKGRYFSDKKIFTNKEMPLAIFQHKTGSNLIEVIGDKMNIYTLNKSGNRILYRRSRDIFRKALTFGSGMIFNTSKTSFVFSNVNDNLASFEYGFRILDAKTFGSMAVFKYKEGTEIKYAYFELKGGGKKKLEIDEFKSSCMNKDFVFEPADGKIIVYRIKDMQVVSEIECPKCNSHSSLHFSTGGILLVNHDSIYLINTK